MPGLQNFLGQTLGGRYRIDEILGKGGMSAVYKAFDPNLRRTVAIKIIHSHLADDPKFITRFQEEAAAVAMLRHPNIVQVYDFNHDADDLYYMVQEYISGETLQERLRLQNAIGERMPVTDAVRLTIQVANAAEYAHQRGMIHRDIKPANIMIDQSGQGILMDFGIVKIIGGAHHTSTGVVVGTALYMAPETIHGQPPDPRSDIYSLGVTLFEMVSGRPPFEADSAMAVMMMHISSPLPDLQRLRPDTPAGLIAIIEKALAKKNTERYESMTAFAADLKAFARQQAAGAPNTLNLNVDTPPAGRLPARPAREAETLPPPNGGATSYDGATRRDSPAATPPPWSRSAAGASSPQAAPPAAGPTRVETPPASYRESSGPFSAQQVSGAAPQTSKAANGRQNTLLPKYIFIVPVILLVALVMGGLGLFVLSRAANSPDKAAAAAVSSTPASQATSAAASPTTAPVAVLAENTATPTHTAAPPSPTPPPDTPTAPALAPTPEAPTPVTPPPGEPFARIDEIQLGEDGRYQVTYETFEFTERLDATHLIFFFNTQTTSQGYMYGGPRPFDKLTAAERPKQAVSMCIAVANPDHSPRPNSGACTLLPDVAAITAGEDTICRTGPGLEFDSAAIIHGGRPALALGISSDESWWQVANPDAPDGACFLPVAGTRADGDISSLPLAGGPLADTPAQSVEITAITIDAENRYAIDYKTNGFSEKLPGTHIHFFFDTFTADQVGMNGGGNRLMYGGPSPFTGFTTLSRPPEAMQICALVANPDHSVIPNSGNCFMLPDMH